MKMLKTVVIMVVMMTLVTGCWNKRELNELVIALAVGVDKTENGYLFSVQLINPTTSSQATKKGAVGPTVRTVSAEGKTLFEAWRRLTKSTPRKVYFAHVQVLVLGENLVKKGIAGPLDPLIRDHELRNDFFVVVSKGNSAKEVLSILTFIEPIPALSLHSMLMGSTKNFGTVTSYKFDELLEDLKTKGKELAVTGVILNGDPEKGRMTSNTESSIPETEITLDNLAVFKKDKLVGWFNTDQSKGYNYSQGNIKSTTEILNCPNGNKGKMTIEIIRTDSKMTAELIKGEPRVDIEIEAEGNIVDAECKIDPLDLKVLETIQRKLDHKIESLVKDAITVSQEEFNSDILGFGSTIHRKEHAYWDKHQKEWNDMFPSIQSKVKVTSKLHNTGTLGKSLTD